MRNLHYERCARCQETPDILLLQKIYRMRIHELRFKDERRVLPVPSNAPAEELCSREAIGFQRSPSEKRNVLARIFFEGNSRRNVSGLDSQTDHQNF